MSKASDAGLSFLAGVFAKLPESVRSQVEAAFKDPQAEEALVVIGTGALAQPEINRRLDELKTKETELDTLKEQNQVWWEKNSAAVQEYLEIKPEYDKLKGTPPVPPKDTPPPAGLDQKTIEAMMEARDRSFAGAFALGVTMSARHLNMFGEPLDMSELMADARLGQPIKDRPGFVFGLQDAYNAKHGERVAAKAKEAEDARISKLVEERLTEERKKQPTHLTYPLRDSSPSPLDALTGKPDPSQFTVDAAVAEYERLQQVRSGSP